MLTRWVSLEIVQQDTIFRELWIILPLVEWTGMKWKKIKVDFEGMEEN